MGQACFDVLFVLRHLVPQYSSLWLGVFFLTICNSVSARISAVFTFDRT